MSKKKNSIYFTLGCDPEIFLVDSAGAPVSALGLVPGTKAKPEVVDCGAIQVDGMAAEFNTDPVPLGDFDAFNTNVVRVMKTLETTIKKENPKVRLRIAPTLEFGKEFLDAQPDEAKELGCDPDFCAYTLEANPRPDGDRTFRTGAGHIHIGWGSGIPADNPEHLAICASFIKMLDATVGMLMTYIDREPLRRELYGKAGAFRPKPYGVEYRTPSNVWLKAVSYRRAIHSLTNIAVTHMKAGTSIQDLTSVKSETIRDIIDTGNYSAAAEVLSRLARIDSYFGATFSEVRRIKEKELESQKPLPMEMPKEKKVA